MQPVVHIQSMKDTTPYKRKRICAHVPQCKEYLIIFSENGGLTLCQKDAVESCQTIFDKLHVIPEIPIRTQGWTDEETIKLINFVNSHKFRYGTITELAAILGKSHKQVKDKIYYLRRANKTDL